MYISPFGVVKLAIKWTPGPLFEERFLGREHESHRVVVYPRSSTHGMGQVYVNKVGVGDILAD